jgi:VWFA-related protein
MRRTVCSQFALTALALGLVQGLSAYQDAPVVFKSDVSLVRVDVQVVSSTNQLVGGLHREDFELRESGQVRDIVNFGRENLPLDLVLLLDVSGSMRPHVEQIAQASHEALRVLGNEDRVAILVFDRSTRTSMPFKSNHDEIVRGFEQLLDRENFNGGTDITRGMYDAVKYMQRNARPGSRRAIVILTDDRTEFNRDDFGVGRALEDANTVMSALISPDAIGGPAQRYPGSSRRGGSTGGGWPGGIGGGLGGIIFGGGGIPGSRRVPGGGNGPVTVGNGRLKSAGTEEIARASGGDSMTVENASALQDTLERIRQSYALYFNAPEGVKQGEKRNVQIALTSAATRRYSNAELRYRPSYVVSEGGTTSGPMQSDDTPTVTRRNPGATTQTSNGGVFDSKPAQQTEDAADDAPKVRRRVAVDEPGSGTGGWRKIGGTAAPAKAEEPKAAETAPAAKTVEPAPAAEKPAVEAEQPKQGGFKRVKPGEKP